MHAILLLLFSSCPATLAHRDGYTVCYDVQNQRPLWTRHEVRPSSAPSQRKSWRIDHELNSLSAKAFTNSGFDRGHLATSADLPNSKDVFLTSNAIAQDPKLNRGEWARIENRIRRNAPATVITGAIYNHCGNETIEAPCQVFKIALFDNGDTLAAVFTNGTPQRK